MQLYSVFITNFDTQIITNPLWIYEYRVICKPSCGCL